MCYSKGGACGIRRVCRVGCTWCLHTFARRGVNCLRNHFAPPSSELVAGRCVALPWTHAASGVRTGSSRCACTRRDPGSGASCVWLSGSHGWSPAFVGTSLGSAAVGDRSSTGNPMAGATSTASPYYVALRGAPGSGCGLYQGELGPEAHERNTPFLCNRASCCVPEAPLKGPLHIFISTM